MTKEKIREQQHSQENHTQEVHENVADELADKCSVSTPHAHAFNEVSEEPSTISSSFPSLSANSSMVTTSATSGIMYTSANSNIVPTFSLPVTPVVAPPNGSNNEGQDHFVPQIKSYSHRPAQQIEEPLISDLRHEQDVPVPLSIPSSSKPSTTFKEDGELELMMYALLKDMNARLERSSS